MSTVSVPSARILAALALLSVYSVPAGAQTTSTLVAVSPPCRVVDTRLPAGLNANGSFGGPSIAAKSTLDLDVPGSGCGIPSNATAYSVNVTVVPPNNQRLNYIVLWPTGVTMPLVSTLNDTDGKIVANAAVVPAGVGGRISIYATDNTDIILDINGYFLPLPVNTSGMSLNTAVGVGTSNAGGVQNTAVGASALAVNAGNLNTALGAGALASHSSGDFNTAVGSNALSNSSGGQYNSALGSTSLLNNTSGTGNTALGYASLSSNTLGQDNTAVGNGSLGSNLSGLRNIGIGLNAGVNLTTTGDNIDIANSGVSGDSGVIRIGTAGVQYSAYLAGVFGNAAAGGSQLFINSSGKLGTNSSSRRYKEDIRDIGDVSSDIFKLRPVQFRYKQAIDDGSKPLQYGLIAEEVEAVYPQLIIHNKDGQIEGVQYQQLPAMLLNELQKQQKTIARQEESIEKLLLRLETLESQATGQPAVERFDNQ